MSLPRHVCPRCRLQTVAPMVEPKTGCTNAVACAKRVARNRAAAAANEKAADKKAKKEAVNG